jgi:hypothetical protein
MRNKRKLLVSTALLLVSGSAVAQRSFSVVAGGQIYLTNSRFVYNQPNSRQIGLSSYPYTGFMLGIGVGLSPRYMMQATIGSNSYGLNLEPQNIGKLRFKQQARELTLVVRRQFSNGSKAGHLWFVDLGADALSAGSGAGIIGFGASRTVNGNPGANPGFRITGYSTFRNSFRVGVRLGAGREWALNEHHHIALGAVASIGLSDLHRYKVQTVTWQEREDIDPISSENTLATRFSFVGVQARYRFQL